LVAHGLPLAGEGAFVMVNDKNLKKGEETASLVVAQGEKPLRMERM
jgi:hypothetical protein